LVAATGCDDLLGWVKAEASQRLDQSGGIATSAAAPSSDTMVDAADSAVPSTSPQREVPTAGRESATGTNNQVANVDEGDHVKVVGDRLIVLANRTLAVFGLSPDLPKIGVVELPSDASEFLIVNGKVITIGTTYGSDGRVFTSMSQVSIDNVPTVEFSTTVDGAPVSTRLASGAMRIVISNQRIGMGVGFSTDGDYAANVTAVNDSTIEQWLPARSDEGRRSTLVECTTALKPVEFSGFGSLTILTVAGELNDVATTSIMASGQTVYANDSSLYVATVAEPAPNAREYTPATDIHRFDISGTTPARYEGSGRVPGTLLNQYSMDEQNDILRIATTEGGSGFIGMATDGVAVPSGDVGVSSEGGAATDPVEPAPDSPVAPPAPSEPCGGPAIDCAPTPAPTPSPPGEPVATSEPNPRDPPTPAPEPAPTPGPPAPAPARPASRVTTLALKDGALVELGHLDGLGVGETIQSVRFEGNLASIVTFRQVDPLFSIDLSDPASPKLLGELKVPGFSNYLHPVGDGRLLGVGVGGDNTGTNGSAKVTLFDNSNPATPREITSWTSPNTSLNAGFDPHSFTWDPETRLAVTVGSWANANYQTGAIVLKVDGDTITEVGRLTADPATPPCPGYPELGDPGTKSSGPSSSDAASGTVEPCMAPAMGITRAFVTSGSIYAVADRQVLSFDLSAKRTGAASF